MVSKRYYFIFCNLLHPATLHNLRFTKGFASAGAGSWGISKVQPGDSFWQAYEDGSADYLPFIPNTSEKLAKAISPFWMNVTSGYRVEYDAELYRRAYKPLLPSRFSAIYAFGDWESCQAAAGKYAGWDLRNVRVFELEPAPYNRVAKVNMEVVTLARDAYPTASFPAKEIDAIWEHYWGGKGDMMLEYIVGDRRKQFNSGVIWEYLIEGRVNKIDADPATFKAPKP